MLNIKQFDLGQLVADQSDCRFFWTCQDDELFGNRNECITGRIFSFLDQMCVPGTVDDC